MDKILNEYVIAVRDTYGSREEIIGINNDTIIKLCPSIADPQIDLDIPAKIRGFLKMVTVLDINAHGVFSADDATIESLINGIPGYNQSANGTTVTLEDFRTGFSGIYLALYACYVAIDEIIKDVENDFNYLVSRAKDTRVSYELESVKLQEELILRSYNGAYDKVKDLGTKLTRYEKDVESCRPLVEEMKQVFFRLNGMVSGVYVITECAKRITTPTVVTTTPGLGSLRQASGII